MKTQVLSSVQALQPGAEIWILPTPHESPWSARIDWYLNFQLSRGLKNQSAHRSPVLEKLLDEIKWALPADVQIKHAPLLIATMGRLPAEWILVPERWDQADKIFEPTLGLKRQHLRVFAPSHFKSSVLKDSGLPSTAVVEIVNPAER